MALTVIYGPMFARKTTTLLKHARADDLLIKPAMDTRYSANNVVTHDGLARPALPVSRWPREGAREVERILIDEIQFFTSPYYTGDILQDIVAAVERGQEVVVAGLDRNWRALAFPMTARLIEVADHLVPLVASCQLCGGDARYTWRRGGAGETIVLGEHDLYEARCQRHHPLLNDFEAA